MSIRRFRTSVGTRVRVVVTDLGVYHPVDGELQLDALHEGVTLDQVKAARPTADYDTRYGATSGAWTTDLFVEAVYRSLSRR